MVFTGLRASTGATATNASVVSGVEAATGVAAGLRPFVKWAGGKTQLLPLLRERLPERFNNYFEPFVGGGALFFDLLPERAVINDCNEQLINVYRQLRVDAAAVAAAVARFDARLCDRDFYVGVRDGFNRKIAASVLDVECAAMFIWLNKHCFNGLYRVNSRGFFNVPFNNRVCGVSVDPGLLVGVGGFLRGGGTVIRLGDFEDAVFDAVEGDLVYFDSPYLPVSVTASFTRYQSDGFGWGEHVRLASLFRRLDERGVFVVLSNNDVPAVHELYEGFRVESFPVRRAINSVGGKRTGVEVIVRNF